MASDTCVNCLGHCLQHTRHAINTLTLWLHFKGKPASLATFHPTATSVASLSVQKKSAVLSTEGSFVRVHIWAQTWASWLPGVWVPCEPGLGRRWGLPQALAGKLKCFSTYSKPTRAYSWSPGPQLPVVQAIGLIPLEQPNCQCEGLPSWAQECLPAKPIWVQPIGCCS